MHNDSFLVEQSFRFKELEEESLKASQELKLIVKCLIQYISLKCSLLR